MLDSNYKDSRIIWEWSKSTVFIKDKNTIVKFSKNWRFLSQEASALQNANRVYYSQFPNGIKIWAYTFHIPELYSDESSNKESPHLIIERALGLSYLSLFYMEFYGDKLNGVLLDNDKDVLTFLTSENLEPIPHYVMEEDPMWKILLRRMQCFWQRVRKNDGIEEFIEKLAEIWIIPSDLNP